MARRNEYTHEQQKWRSWQDEDDRLRKKFYDQVDQFPNLFTLKPHFKNERRLKEVLKKQRDGLASGFEYNLETVRCQNLIVFLLCLLGSKQEALEECEKLLLENGRSYITLTNLAVLQWKLSRTTESQKTLQDLLGLYAYDDYEYLLMVAKSEVGHAYLSYGPKFFPQAMNLYHELLKECPNANVYLWKYDLALSIRRHFNIFVYFEQSSLTASALATEAAGLLADISAHCPNNVYKARAEVELASLLSHLKSFINCCKEEDREVIEGFCRQDHMCYVEQALESLTQGQEDFYVLRVCGRLYKYAGDEETAIRYLERALELREDGIVNQLLGKTYLSLAQKQKAAGTNHGASLAGGAENCDERKAPDRLRSCPADIGTYPQQAPPHSVGESISSESFSRDADAKMACDTDQFEADMLASPEALRLAAEFDRSVARYIDEDGSFKSEQTDNGTCGTVPTAISRNIEHTVGTVPTPISRDEEMARHLEREFDESVLMNDDGSYKVQETEGVGNIRKHRHDDEKRAPTLRPSLSFPPPHHTSKQGSHRNHGFHTTSKTSVLRCLLRCSHDFNRYDEADSLVQKAVNHFNRALEIDPCNKGLIYDVGRLYQGMNKPEKAVTFFELITDRDLGSFPLELVNAYEQAGLCWLKLSEQPGISDEDQKCRVSRAEDMFMSSLRECRRAVAHMPRISSNRGHLWSSYSEMLGILQKSSGEMGVLKKAAKVHELVGKYIEAVKVYRDVLQLARTTDDRKNAILGMVRNYFSMDNVKDARFILDLLLSSDQRDIILQDTDTVTRELRRLAVDVYKRAATAALQLGSVRDARLCFQSVLLLRGVVKEIAAGDDDVVYCSGHGDGAFDACIFDDEVSCATEVADKLAQASSSLVKIMEMVFGMRVNLNDGGVAPNHLSFVGELQLAGETGIVLLVLPPVESLSPRMTFLADTALQSQRARCVLPVVLGEPSCHAPPPLHRLPNFSGALDLLKVADNNADISTFKENSGVIVRLFDNIVCAYAH